MNTQMDRPRGHGDPHDHNTRLQHLGMEDERHDETEHHDEKKSMLKKVKEKAKKIKDTIKCGVGHGHGHGHDEENDDNEMVSDRNVHGAPAAHDITTGKTDTTRLHGPSIVETTTIRGQVPMRNPQVHRVTGQEETLSGSRVDTREPVGCDNQIHGIRHPHVLDADSGGTHRPKLGGILEKDPHTLKNVGDVNPASHHRTNVTDLTSGATHGITSAREHKARQHGTSIGERTPIGGHVPVSNPGSHQVFDTTTTHTVPGQEKILDWSRTDKQTPLGSEHHTQGLSHKPALATLPGGTSTDRPKVGGTLEKDARASKNIGGDVHHVNRQTDLTYPAGGAVHGKTTSKEDKARQHGTNMGERTAIGSQVPVSNPDAYQVFDTTTTRYVPGQDATLGWSRIDKQTPLGPNSQHHGVRHTPVRAGHHSGGTHSTGDLGVGHRPKLGGILEKDPHASKNLGKDVHSANYQPNVTNLTGEGNVAAPAQDLGFGLGQGGRTASRYESNLEGRGTTEGASHIPGINPIEHHTFDKGTSNYIPEHRETLGWARSEERPYATKNTPDTASLGGHLGTRVLSSGQKGDYGRLGEVIEKSTGLDKDPHAPRDVGEMGHAKYHQAKVFDPLGRGNVAAPAQDIGFGLGQGERTASRYEGNLEGRGTTGGASHLPGIKPIEHHTFDKGTSRYIPEHKETLGWARTEERPYATKNTPDTASLGGYSITRVLSSDQKGDYGNLGEVLERSTGLEKDPHAPRDIGDLGCAEYHQAKVIDPLGRGSEEIGVTPILHQLGKTGIHGETTQNPGSYENQAISTGSHDQFSPEPVTPETSTFLQPQESTPQSHTTLSSSHQGFRDESNWEPQERDSNYTNMISSAASELAQKAKVVTNSVTSKLGYSGTSETETSRNTSTVPSERQPLQRPLDSQPVSGGYGETLSTVSVVADKVSKAKDAVALKLGYGGEAYEAQSDESNVGSIRDYEKNDEARESNAGSIGDYGKKVVSTVQEKIAPVYEKVAGLGSTVASKVRGSGTEEEMGSTLEQEDGVPVKKDKMESVESDKGVSVKEYLVEKLKPSEEDQALSKAITEALPLHKQEQEENEIGLGQGDEILNVDETVLGLGDEVMNVDEIGLGQGDEVMKVEIEERAIDSGRETMKTKVVITGQVTESEEMPVMPHHLGRAEETSYDDDSSGLVSPGKSVMERIKDAAGSLFSKSGEQSTEGNERSQSNTVRELQHDHNLNAREAGLQ